MHGLQNKTGDYSEGTNIKDAFKYKQSNRFYRYYYWKQNDLITCWEQLLHCYYNDLLENGSSRWLFRGDMFGYKNDSERSMENAFNTSLDKAFKEFDTPADISSQQETLRNKIEKQILRSFRRRAHLLTSDKDGTQTHLETFALLRHYGGPARILDWTYSFFPAVYLAISRYDENDTYTVWVLNRKWLNRTSNRLEDDFLANTRYIKRHFGRRVIEKRVDLRQRHRNLKYLQKYNNNLFQSYVVTYLMNKNAESGIYAANPYRFNERLAAQRGTLLFSGTVEKTWGENLQDIMNNPPKNREQEEIRAIGPILWEIPLKLSKSRRNEFFRRLDEMNINQATLFPDLGGFAESLTTRIAHPESLGIDV